MTATANPISAPYQASYLMWFRQDLRLEDNTALAQLIEMATQASSTNKVSGSAPSSNCLPCVKALFVITPEQWLEHNLSMAQMDFIFRNLKQLAVTLHHHLNIELHLLSSPTFESCIEDIVHFCQQYNILKVASNFQYEVNEMARDKNLQTRLAEHNIDYHRYHDQCILPPRTVVTNDNTMYKVFTPFYKKWQSILETSALHLHPVGTMHTEGEASEAFQTNGLDTDRLEKTLATIEKYHQQLLRLFNKAYAQPYLSQQNDVSLQENLGTSSETSKNFESLLASTRQAFAAGEAEAHRRLKAFLADEVHQYDIARDQPALQATSQLSPYLAIGVISPRVCYLHAKKAADLANEQGAQLTKNMSLNNNDNGEDKDREEKNKIGSYKDIERWISELAWRDFYRHVIVERPDIVKGVAFNELTDQKVNWSYNLSDFKKWCEGKTGVPLVDAAMRCLNQTGFMHNRLRMVVAMFLTKDLFIDWRWGEKYFMQQLIDADFASNNGGWQWSASVGTDAAPYFRIMNPFSQAKTHDKQAIFIKTWLPELKDIPANILNDEAKLRQALSDEGEFAKVNYPLPIVEHKHARLYAIEQFKG